VKGEEPSTGPASTGPILTRTRPELAAALSEVRAGSRTLALVPTMGYLHEGHLRLVDEARQRADAVALTLFVNPLQFGPGEDLDRYPRDEARDLRLAGQRGVDLVFAPPGEVVYPHGEPVVRVTPGALGERLCGRFRPGHFAGVLTVVAKLFGLFRPSVAVFGRKDYQQAVLIRRMNAELDLGVTIHVGPLVREHDGLALSSRNAYLSEAERRDAAGLFRALDAADLAFRQGERSRERLLDRAREELARSPRLEVQYLELVDPESLDPLPEARTGAVLAVAAHCGPSRLIDNLVLGGVTPDPRLPAPGEDGFP
jgi:pantoate--beta-alanine ligase